MLARRSVVKGVAGLPLASLLANPALAAAAAAELQTVRITTDGGRKVAGALAKPAQAPAAAVMLVHEWWGLNDQIKTVARELAKEGYLALAIDLYKGQVATSRDGARALMGGVAAGEAVDTVASWARWLKGHELATGKLGTVGWCFGGGWSLNASLHEAADATVVYYGRVIDDAGQLAKLKGPVLGHFASRDQWINQDMVGRFEKAMDAAGRPYTSHWYEADHAFANPTSARYDQEDAQLAWQRTLEFFAANLKG
ncbi:MAG: dienelactone hydrolase family protein [Alphaproteobacteria bacterium]|jgi:carboxymethylenebutenolidase|nr:dienelactone hydrolase family protein [Alphaproteobacteria bacterium]MDP6811567.1 dienelactone hydrolase family protein [Alphaproteobacteria bacterium]